MEYINDMSLGGVCVRGKAVSDLNPNPLPRFASVADMVKELRPCEPVHCLDPEALAQNAALFVDHFPGTTLYAVKVNPEPAVLSRLYAAGVRHFDVASRAEAKLVHDLFPDAHMAFMHPVKSREAIRAAYFDYGVRDFSVDTFEELHKICEETKAATDLGIHIRLCMPRGSALLDLSTKFGATFDDAVSLLRDADKVAHRVGVCFHVGSQTMEPESFAWAIKYAGEIVQASGVSLDVMDVGGGFPAFYPGMDAPPMLTFFDTIRTAVAALNLPSTCQVWGEPGRALVANAGTVVVRVELRKGNSLYINDGTFGSLFDAGCLNWRYPVQLVHPTRKIGKEMASFRFYGPTCTGEDVMEGPFMLPSDICEGDWIAISQMGAYGMSMQTKFNGFYSDQLVEIAPTTKSALKLVKKPAKKPELFSV